MLLLSNLAKSQTGYRGFFLRFMKIYLPWWYWSSPTFYIIMKVFPQRKYIADTINISLGVSIFIGVRSVVFCIVFFISLFIPLFFFF